MSFQVSIPSGPATRPGLAEPEPKTPSERAFEAGAPYRQAAILSAVAFAAERFLKSADWRESIDEVLAKLGHATGVSRIYIFENRTQPDGSLCASQTCEWVAEGIEPQLESPELQGLSYDSDALEPLRETTSKGEVLVQLVREMPQAARDVLEPQNILSIAIVPIFTRDAWIGFLGFDDCAQERKWSAVELDALKAASGILGAAMQRTADEEQLRQKEEQLRQAQKMEAVGNLAGGIAHDFNNVLQIIWLSGEALRSKLPRESPLLQDIRIIGDAVLRARALPNQLLAFARRQVVQPRLQDLDESVAEIADLVRRIIDEDVRLEVESANERTLIVVDPVQLQQAVMNLILNASDAMPRGGQIRVGIKVSCVKSELVFRHARIPAGDFAVVTVDDDGVGMDDETLERLFEPFYTTKVRGNGIGLATVYGIVKQNGGHITVESELGTGSRFAMYFPLAQEPHQLASLPSESEDLLCGSETVLVVEDEEPLRTALSERLAHLGYEVIAASDGLSACERLTFLNRRVDMLLTDVVMPKMDGVLLAARVREKHPDVKVLFMSGHAFDALERRGVDPSKLNVLRKPFSAVELARNVREVLDA